MMGQMLKDEAAVAETLVALRVRLSAVADQLLAGGRLSARVLRHDLLDTANGEMDGVAIEARQVESHLVRRIFEMDQETQRLLASLRQQTETVRRPGLRARFGLGRPERFDAEADRRAIAVLVDLVRETDVMLGALEDHRTFLRTLLLRSEQALDEALVRLRALAARPEGDHMTDGLQAGIDLLQELVDRIIGLIAAASLLVNKLSIDAEERIVALSGLGFVLSDAEDSVPRLANLFRRAERGLLSVRGLVARKERINEMFRFRRNASRQAATG